MSGYLLAGLGGLLEASEELGEPLRNQLQHAHDESDEPDARRMFGALLGLDQGLAARALLALDRWDQVRGFHDDLVTLDELRVRAEAVAQAEGEEARLDAEALKALVVALGGEG